MIISNLNITKRGTQATGFGVMIGRCSLDSPHGRRDYHPVNVGCSLFRYLNNDISNHNNRRPKRKTWTREDNQLALHCYFKSNPSQRGYRKIEIWQECASFQTTSQGLADQVKTIIKKRWFSDLDILEIHQKTQKQDNTIPVTSSNANQKQHTRNELLTLEDNQLALHCYFKSNPSQRGYRKIEIWQECASFQTTSQGLADQVRTIIKKRWFSDLDILEIHQKTQKQDNTIPVTSSNANQKQHTRNELPTLEDNQLALHCYFKSNPSQRGYRKIEIWQECASFQTTSQGLADQVKTIIKKRWFSDLDILEIHQKTQKQDNTIPVTSSNANQKQHTRNELLTLEDNQLALHCYFKSNPSQRGYRKIEIWQECASFQTTSQGLADQVRTIIKKRWFSDLDILEIHQKTQKQDNTIPVTSSNANQKQHTRNELPTLEDNQLALHCYFKSNPSQRGYRKIEIWRECASFQTSQGLADQVKTIIKKRWFSDLDILEIHQKTQKQDNTIPVTSSNANQK